MAYPLLAAVVTVLLLVDSGIEGMLQATETRLFDTLITHRIRTPAADPSIVILDIDEASLAALAAQHGRWPWPNTVFAEMVQGLEQAGAKSIVFDILFADWDTLRPASDAAFNAAIANTRNTYFPMLRLDPRNDALSKIPVNAIPGAQATTPTPDTASTIAIILPKVPAAIDNGRLGTHQVQPDHDGIIRRYPLWIHHAGWRLPSLPTVVAQDWPGTPNSVEGDGMLLNWRGPPFSYRYVSFANAYRALVQKQGAAPMDFANKVVIIGSTAPSLFDTKGTPMARIHPGVEILATAIDNLHQGDMLRERPRWALLAAALALVWGMALALYRQVRIEKFDLFFGALQVTLVAIAYALLNVSHWYIDVSAPFSIGVAFFTVARIYYTYSHKLLAESTAAARVRSSDGPVQLATLALRLDGARAAELRRLNGVIDRLVAQSSHGAARVAHWIEGPGLVHESFAGTVVVYWVDAVASAHWRDESDHMENSIRALFDAATAAPRVHVHRHSDTIDAPTLVRRQQQCYGIIVSALSGLASNHHRELHP